MQDRVYGELRRWLMVGRFLPGESITLRNLAAELGVSPMPVRAALRHLIAEGGFEMLPNRAVRVPRMTRERLRELLAVRRELEGMATAQACRNMTRCAIPRDREAARQPDARARRRQQRADPGAEPAFSFHDLCDRPILGADADDRDAVAARRPVHASGAKLAGRDTGTAATIRSWCGRCAVATHGQRSAQSSATSIWRARICARRRCCAADRARRSLGCSMPRAAD